MRYPKTVDEILAHQDIPVVSADDQGIITYINKAFSDAYGWKSADLVGQSLTVIMPDKFREAHQFGFARFLSTEQPRVAGQPLPLEVRLKDGSSKLAEHFILGDKKDNRWRFAATIVVRSA